MENEDISEYKLSEALRAFLNAPCNQKALLTHPLMLTTFTKLSVEKAYFRYRARPEERHRRTSANVTGHAYMLTFSHNRKTINWLIKVIAPYGYRCIYCMRY